MADWRDNQYRYLIHFADGGVGMRFFDEPLTVGQHITDGGDSYVISKFERQPERVGFVNTIPLQIGESNQRDRVSEPHAVAGIPSACPTALQSMSCFV